LKHARLLKQKVFQQYIHMVHLLT